MTTKVLHDPTLDETVHKCVLPSGLTAYVVHKPEFTRSYATMGTRYGSVDTRMGKGKPIPDGTAHFLEHKMFETPDGDAFDRFAALGGSANAYTSFTHTQYLFGTSTEYAANLETLFDLVFDLHVDKQNVEKEKGIIGQEIAMYDDDPDWRLYFGALQAMYKRHPVRIDIAGTHDSIAPITPELLREVHRHYYHPRNMVLAAVSPEPVEKTLAVAKAKMAGRRFGAAPGLRPPPPREPRRAALRDFELKLPVARPRLLMACKDTATGRRGKTLLRREIASAIVMDCLFGNSGTAYLSLYDQGLIDESFSSGYTADPSFAFALLGGETDDPVRLRTALDAELGRARKQGISSEAFERVRNKELGGFARAFNSPQSIAHVLTANYLRGTTIRDYRDLILKVTRAETNRRLREIFEPAGRTYGTLAPR
ncbi:MAG: EF-P 5-aminopentanol modification-associated protein YfmH [Planctomycetota bacterium]|jgi:predicted Zn-dependent peptidase